MSWELFGTEIETPYVDRKRDRFIVSLVFGMPDGENVSSPEDAARIAVRDLHLCPSGADHIWCVYDNTTGQRTFIREEDVLPPGVLRLVREDHGVALGHHERPAHDPGQHRLRHQVLDAAESRTWEELPANLRRIDQALRLATEATEDFAGEKGTGHEGSDSEAIESLTPDEVVHLDLEARMAYLRRLTRTIVRSYGGRSVALSETDVPSVMRTSSPAALLHLLAGSDLTRHTRRF